MKEYICGAAFTTDDFGNFDLQVKVDNDDLTLTAQKKTP